MTSATAPAPSTSSSPPASPEPGSGDGNGWPGGFGLYIHWPFCLSKCPYCDFNSHVADRVDHARWRGNLERELRHFAARSEGRRLDSIFFGGGTPSLMEPETAALMIRLAGELWPSSVDLEITLEANPGTVDAARFRDFREAGVNRLSLGVQSFDDAELRFLGRAHDAATARRGIELAAESFERFSFDLIYARPGQTVAEWEAELGTALTFGPEHLSVYQLTIEPGTRFHTLYNRREFSLPEEELAGDLYEATQALLEDAGLPAYEISNHARPGRECRHNLVYWRGGDYAGVGPGAHGRLTGPDGLLHATRQHRAPEIWLERVERDGHATVEDVPVDAEARIEELLMMGLRLRDGISRDRFRRQTGRELADCIDTARIDALTEEGLLTLTPDALTATPSGRQRLNAVLGYLLG
jgi:oxygen-independent coproporphyrinogen-3 oxidase